MPSGILSADTSFPSFSGRESTEEKTAALQDYLFLLLENLRYILRNLGPENLNGTEVIQWLAQEGVGEGVDAAEVADIITAGSIVANELYAVYGDIADVTVWKLRTDWLRARNYLNADTSDINYLYIHDETIEFITASVARDEAGAVAGVEQLSRDGLAFYWTDATRSRMTCTEATAWPVTVYRYDELVKGRIAFEQNEGGVWRPKLTMGAGDQNGNDVAWFLKDVGQANLLYKDQNGKSVGMTMSLEGYTDIYGLRRCESMDLSAWDSGLVTETLEGGVKCAYNVDFDGNRNPIRIYDADHSMSILWGGGA